MRIIQCTLVTAQRCLLQNVINQFMEVFADGRCSFLGNVTVGKDVSLHTMQGLYHAVGVAPCSRLEYLAYM